MGCAAHRPRRAHQLRTPSPLRGFRCAITSDLPFGEASADTSIRCGLRLPTPAHGHSCGRAHRPGCDEPTSSRPVEPASQPRGRALDGHRRRSNLGTRVSSRDHSVPRWESLSGVLLDRSKRDRLRSRAKICPPNALIRSCASDCAGFSWYWNTVNPDSSLTQFTSQASVPADGHRLTDSTHAQRSECWRILGSL